MGLFGRISNLVKGKVDRTISNAEKSDPDAIYRAAIEEKTKDLKDLQELAREAKGLEMKEIQEIDSCNSRLTALEVDLELAVETSNEEVGTALLEEIEGVKAELAVNETEKEEYANQAANVIASLEAVKKDLKALKDEHVEAAQLEKSHKVMKSIADRAEGLGTDATSAALSNARTRINGIKADQASMGATKAATLENKRKALREEAATGKNKNAFKELMKDKKAANKKESQ